MAKPENSGTKHARDNKGRRHKGTSGDLAGKAKGKTPARPPQRTPEEQALVDDWQDHSRLQRPLNFKAGDKSQEVVPDTQDEALWAARLAKALGTPDTYLIEHFLNQAANVTWKTEAPKASNQAVAAIQGIAPRDELEAMLAVQMVAVHNAAMECLRRAMIPEQTFEGRDQNLKYATKLTRTFTAQVETLNRHRGKGQQKVTVEHVHVHQGGQAIVGHVESGGPGGAGGQRKDEEQPHALTHAPELTMSCPDPEREAVPVAGGPGAEAVPDAWR